ncbi:hypothetical protein F4678DRAFT_408006 [Xylaria arbuscula]|nr:hypothetical protein F4678DRAFT_408006 [Xylaria arbuscula]
MPGPNGPLVALIHHLLSTHPDIFNSSPFTAPTTISNNHQDGFSRLTMLLKESARVLSSNSNLAAQGVCSPVSCVTASLSSSSSIPSPCSGNSQRPRARSGQHPGPRRRHVEHRPGLGWNHPVSRCYASVSWPAHNHPPAGYTWPASLYPTPYEVLAQPRDAPYNKVLFYQLVKVYHPDRNYTDADSSIPHSVRLERYRLVVAANEILSDDAKRKAYDLYGAGWNGNRTMQDLYREADRSWRDEPGNASRNATWEDWEKWRRERNGEPPPQNPVFMSNELFVIVLCSLVVAGSFAQARRANSNTLNIVEMRDQKHAAISDDMRRRQYEKTPLNRHERVESFLRQRDSWNLASSVHRSSESPP